MEDMKVRLEDIKLLDIGNSIQLSGTIWSGNGYDYICFFPDEFDETLGNEMIPLEMSLDDWKKFIRQTDIMETEILAKDTDGKIVKAILRKTQRQIEQRLQWRVFKRDEYTCRYCGADDVPLTVDHIVLWEEGGPTIEENLVAACRKCNKTRGNQQYKDWLDNKYYKEKSKNLSEDTKLKNAAVAHLLDSIPRQYHKKSR